MTKYNEEFKRKVIRHYVITGGNVRKTASYFGLSHGFLERWIAYWNGLGEAWFSLQPQSLSAERKEAILLDMWHNHLTSLQAAVKYKILSVASVQRWEKLYHEGGIEALQSKKRGRPPLPKSSEKKTKTQPLEYPEFKSVEEELIYLRAENAYLKKLKALILLGVNYFGRHASTTLAAKG